MPAPRKYATEEERKEAINASWRARYERNKLDPEFMARRRDAKRKSAAKPEIKEQRTVYNQARYAEVKSDPEKLEQKLTRNREFMRDKYWSLTEEERKVVNRKRFELKIRGVVFHLCDRCHLWRREEHKCVALFVDPTHLRHWHALHPQNLKVKPFKAEPVRKAKPRSDNVIIAERWPYGCYEWPMDVVAKHMPDNLPNYVRADAGQELCVLLLTEEIAEDQLGLAMKKVITKAWGPWVKSLDKPNEEGFTLGDYLVATDL